MNYSDLGFDRFLTKPLLTSSRQSPSETRNSTALGSLGASYINTPLNPITDIVLTSTDYNTAAWSTGTIYFADGTASDKIDAGNTGDITANSYVYYDRNSPTVLKVATEHEQATGSAKLLVAIVRLGESGKDCEITPTVGAGLVVTGITANQIEAGTITADEIASHTITADEISAGTITATEISGDQLDVIAANTGTLTVDEYISVGEANIKIDGTNRRITVNDGTNDRILIGKQTGGF
jgi:hypothetical protein